MHVRRHVYLCVCVSVFVCAFICMCVLSYVRSFVWMCVRMYVCLCVCVYTLMYVCFRMYVWLCFCVYFMCVCWYVLLFVYFYVYVCICVFLCVWFIRMCESTWSIPMHKQARTYIILSKHAISIFVYPTPPIPVFFLHNLSPTKTRKEKEKIYTLLRKSSFTSFALFSFFLFFLSLYLLSCLYLLKFWIHQLCSEKCVTESEK